MLARSPNLLSLPQCEFSLMCYKLYIMNLTTAEKTVIGTIVFLMFVLLAQLGLQFYISQANIDLRRLFSPPASTVTTTSDSSQDYTDDSAVEDTMPTEAEEVSAKRPRSPWVGWSIIIGSSLLLITAVGIKFFSA